LINKYCFQHIDRNLIELSRGVITILYFDKTGVCI